MRKPVDEGATSEEQTESLEVIHRIYIPPRQGIRELIFSPDRRGVETSFSPSNNQESVHWTVTYLLSMHALTGRGKFSCTGL